MWQCAVFSLSIWDWTGIDVRPDHLAFVLAFNSNRVEGIQIVVIQSAASCIVYAVYAGSKVTHGNTWQQSMMDKKKNGGACSKNFSDIWWYLVVNYPVQSVQIGSASQFKNHLKKLSFKGCQQIEGIEVGNSLTPSWDTMPDHTMQHQHRCFLSYA